MNTEGRVVYNTLELMQILRLDMLPNKAITLNWSNKKLLEMKNGSFSELCLLTGLLWSVLPDTGDHVDIFGWVQVVICNGQEKPEQRKLDSEILLQK